MFRASAARAVSALLAGALGLGAMAAAAVAETRRALVIGVNDYADPKKLPPLRGAVPDALDLASSFKGLGFADVRTLTGEAVSHQAVTAAWRALLDASAAGDLIFVSFAGHGLRAPARVPASEADEMDEFLALTRFSPKGARRREMLLDDEIAQWIAEAGAKSVRVVLIVDACHSGTTFRNVDPRAERRLRYREAGVVITDDLFDGVDLTAVDAEGAEPPDNLVSFGAALDTQRVPEVLFTDEKTGAEIERGALSYYFSRGLRGQADADDDGAVTFAEMKRYLLRNIRHASNGQQTPNIVAGDEKAVLVSYRRDQAPAEPPADRPLRIAFENLDRDPPELKHVEVALPGEAADLIWDAAAREAIDGRDAIIARGVRRGRVQGVVDRTLAAKRLTAMAEKRALLVAPEPAKPLFFEGETLALTVSEAEAPYRTIFAIDPDGRIALLYPLDEKEAAAAPAAAPLKIGGVTVQGPYGADLVVAVATETPPKLLLEKLRALEKRSADTGKATALQAVEALKTSLRGERFRLGLAPVYSCKTGLRGCDKPG